MMYSPSSPATPMTSCGTPTWIAWWWWRNGSHERGTGLVRAIVVCVSACGADGEGHAGRMPAGAVARVQAKRKTAAPAQSVHRWSSLLPRPTQDRLPVDEQQHALLAQT